MNSNGFEWDLYTHVENLYEVFFVCRLNEFGANLLTLLEGDKFNDEIDIIELTYTIALLTYEEVASLNFFSLETLFIVYFLQVHSDYREIHSLLRDYYIWNKENYLDS
tara:strand:- start:119 stop:442 length:324 start_codon:yes stop_codon:yes gene_type:complete